MILSVVATPIGNVKDITLRAIETLSNATLILAEDTRNTKKLFSLLGISYEGKEFISSHAHSSEGAVERALAACEKHELIALVTDAGTPAISDPGSFFIDLFRTRYVDASVVPIPGPSAITAALSVSGFPGNHFEFLGFIPHKKGRQTLFASLSDIEHSVVFYESPHRIVKTLESLSETIGDRYVFLGREMTKVFEEYVTGTAQDLLAHLINTPEKQRGEFVLIVAPKQYRAVK